MIISLYMGAHAVPVETRLTRTLDGQQSISGPDNCTQRMVPSTLVLVQNARVRTNLTHCVLRAIIVRWTRIPSVDIDAGTAHLFPIGIRAGFIFISFREKPEANKNKEIHQ